MNEWTDTQRQLEEKVQEEEESSRDSRPRG